MNTSEIRTPDPRLRDRLEARLATVEARLAAACARAGRPRSDVTLVAVTKTVDVAVAACLVELGIRDLGENRPQELWRKAAALPAEVRWHMIGHCQRNKVERTLPLVHVIHSADSLRLIDAVEQAAQRQARVVSLLLEVNTSGEASKQGCAPDEILSLVPHLARLEHVRIHGLMTMAPLQAPEACRPLFSALRGLRDRLQAALPAPHRLDLLSMGMSNDFEVAIEEGATHVRLGTVLFEGIVP